MPCSLGQSTNCTALLGEPCLKRWSTWEPPSPRALLLGFSHALHPPAEIYLGVHGVINTGNPLSSLHSCWHGLPSRRVLEREMLISSRNTEHFGVASSKAAPNKGTETQLPVWYRRWGCELEGKHIQKRHKVDFFPFFWSYWSLSPWYFLVQWNFSQILATGWLSVLVFGSIMNSSSRMSS